MCGNTGREFGRVAYTHAAGIDAPLSVIRRGGPYGDVTLIPHSDYRGAYHAGSLPSGAAYNCMPTQPCLYVVWPKKYWGSYWDGGDPANGDWAGSLIRGNQDVSGLMYRRNRYYDPATGQFTQSDPIGIAGGLNTYGFAAGDPISFSDPFGLKADTIKFSGEENGEVARRYLSETVSEAMDAMLSGDINGAILLAMVVYASESSTVFDLEADAFDSLDESLSLGGFEHCSSQSYCKISVNSKTYPTVDSKPVILSHELGGAVMDVMFGVANKFHRAAAPFGENLMRRLRGCELRGAHDAPTGLCE